LFASAPARRCCGSGRFTCRIKKEGR
jgi:hypothetical protein